MTGTADRFGPNAETRAVYEQPYHEVYQAPFPALQPLLHRLADIRDGAGHVAPERHNRNETSASVESGL